MADQKPFSENLFRYLDRIEVVCLVGAVASVLAVNAGMTGAVVGIRFSLFGLAAVFFLNAFKPPTTSPEANEKKDFISLLSRTILPKVLWISCSIGAIGILFHLLQLEGAREQLMIGTAASAIGVVLFAGLSAVNSAATQPHTPALYRAVPILLITGYFLYGTTA